MKTALPLVLFLAVLLFSCKKDTNETEATGGQEVYAGVSDATFDTYDYQPGVEVTINWDAQNLYGTGYDSVDLDMNGSFDLFLTIQALNYDSVHLLNGGYPDPFPSCALSTSDEFELGFYSVSYPTGFGQTASASFVDRLDLSERIDVITDWRDTGKMWQQNPGLTGTPPFGEWNGAGPSHYFAIRKNGNKLGWVELDVTNLGGPLFKQSAICQ